MVTATPTRRSNVRRHHHQARRPRRTEFVACALAAVALAAVGALVAWMATGQGVFLGGDEPSYIVQAQALLHAKTQLDPFIRADLLHHLFAPPSHPSVVETTKGTLSPFEPGMAILLAPFVAIGPLYHAAVAGILLATSAGLVLVHRLATRLTGLGWVGQVLLGVMLASPAVLVAIAQIYPDLPSGVLLAWAVLGIALLERRGSTRPVHVALVAASIAFLPWLQVKNLVPAAILLVVYCFVGLRARIPRRSVLGVAGGSLTSWSLLVLYNERYFGTLLGLREPPEHLTSTGTQYSIGLLLGRDHGLFVQVPFAVLGVLGLCLVLTRLPAAVVATVAALGSVLLLNGNYIVDPYGGGSFEGRFMWALVPTMVAWSTVVLRRWERSGRRLRLSAAVIAGIWVYLAVPFLVGAHNYINVLSKFVVWDPVAVPGWWSGLDRFVPQFDLHGQLLGYPAVGIVFELALATLAVVAALLVIHRSRRLVTVGALAVATLVVVAAVEASATPLPPSALRISGTDLGAPVVTTTTPTTAPPVRLLPVEPGTYRVTMTYLLTGTAPFGGWALSCVPGAPGTPTRATSALPPGGGTSAVVIRCPTVGSLESQLSVGASSVLHVAGLRVAKVSL
jgi:hypothetical protein